MLNETDAEVYKKLNATEVDYPVAAIWPLIEKSIQDTPQAVAVVSGDRALSYRELGEYVAHLCAWLYGRGLRQGDLAGIYLNRDERLIPLLLALFRLGAGYVPLDPVFPRDRLNYMMATSGARFVISEGPLLPTIPGDLVDVINLDLVNLDTLTGTSAGQFAETGSPENQLAYVIFTSGSTGKPKGVMVPQHAVANFLQSMVRTPGIKPGDRLLALTTLSFDISVLELFAPLLASGTVVVASASEAADPDCLVRLLEQREINILQATPATWRILLASDWQPCQGFKALCGGEALPRDLAVQLQSRVTELWNMYGPTETTVWSCCYQVAGVDGPVPVGAPIANTRCLVVNHSDQLQPVDVPGELLIAGAGVTDGYIGMPEHSKERFTEIPALAAGKLYRTGDSVVLRRNGTLEYLNRLDSQVKVRGFRIELEEVEAVLDTHAAIAQSVVLVKEFSETDARLVAFLRFHDIATVTLPEVRRHLLCQLPEYMVPDRFVEIQSFPLTPNGKIDRKALLGYLEDAEEIPATKGRTATESFLISEWKRLLKARYVTPEDNFFELGGHSLLLVEFRKQVHRQTGVELSVDDVALATLQQIAALIDARLETEPVENDHWYYRLLRWWPVRQNGNGKQH